MCNDDNQSTCSNVCTMELRYSCLIANVFMYCFTESLSKSDLSSINFEFNRFFTKLFRTSNTETVKVSQSFFGISLSSVALRNRTDTFEHSLRADLGNPAVYGNLFVSYYTSYEISHVASCSHLSHP